MATSTSALEIHRASAESQRPQETAYARHSKRLLDLAIGIPLLIAGLPLVLILAVIVVATTGWPAFYRGERLGQGGVPFRIWKLRTMVRSAESHLDHWLQENPSLSDAYFQSFKLRDDPRITRVGAFLRKTSLDELPQLWNVVAGDMSLVGPRPIVRAELSHYGDSAAALLYVRPGLTGAWQVGGRNDIEYPERTWVELDYVATLSFLNDMQILVLTLPALLKRKGV